MSISALLRVGFVAPLVVAPLVVVVSLTAPAAALAHERREVGKYAFVVGFNDEPAYQGEPNGTQITITVPSEGDRPIEGAENTLKVSIGAGGAQPKEFPLHTVFRQPGRYVADFVPTRSGAYIFTFTGTLEGQPVNERFESGPGRFDEVRSLEALQYPEPVPPGNEVARLARAADERAAAAEAAAESSRSLALIGLGVGSLGILLAIVALGLLLTRGRDAGQAVPARR
jgi:hypothetical protein